MQGAFSKAPLIHLLPTHRLLNYVVDVVRVLFVERWRVLNLGVMMGGGPMQWTFNICALLRFLLKV